MGKRRTLPMETKTFKTYAEWTPATSIHKTEEAAATACILGIGGEWGEYSEMVDNFTLSQDRKGLPALKENLLKEMGDVFYYLGLMSIALGFENKVRITRASIGPGFYKSIPPLIFKLQEHYKKMIRDNGWKLKGYEKEEQFISVYNELLSMVVAETRKNVGPVEFILNTNKEKLMKRLEEGKIGGSGNDR